MNALTMVLDELEGSRSGDSVGAFMHGKNQSLPEHEIRKLIATLRSQGGDMARIASVIESLAGSGPGESSPQSHTTPTGKVTMPGDRSDMRTLTAGNGVMNGTGI